MTSDFREVGRLSMIGRKSDIVGRWVDEDGTSDFFCTRYYRIFPELLLKLGVLYHRHGFSGPFFLLLLFYGLTKAKKI